VWNTYLHEGIIESFRVDRIVHVSHDLSRQAPGLQVPRHNRPSDSSSHKQQQHGRPNRLQQAEWLWKLLVQAGLAIPRQTGADNSKP
jgi:hypothetical protein